MHELIYKKAAVKGMLKMPVKIRRRMQDELNAITASPSEYEGNWKPLTGSDYWRLRVGGYRAICDLDNGRLIMLVLKAGPRGDIYK
jgi:mRNA interferase RelE/StbE